MEYRVYTTFFCFRDQSLMNIRFVKQDPIVIQTPDDSDPEHLTVSSLTATPFGRILVVDAWRGYTCIKMYDIEGQHLSDLAIPPGDYDITTANEEKAILLQWPITKLLIVDISSTEMSVKQKIEIDRSLCAKYVTAVQDKFILSCCTYPKYVKMFDRTGNLIWSRRIENIHSSYIRNASCIVSYFEDNNPKLRAADVHVPFVKQAYGLVQLDVETGTVIKVNKSENMHPIGMDVDIERGILYFMTSSADQMVWGSTLDFEHQRELLTTETGLSVGSQYLCFNPANQQLLVATRKSIDRFQMVL